MIKSGYISAPISGNGTLVSESLSVARNTNTIHMMTEVDVSKVRTLLKLQKSESGLRISLTSYVVACLAKTVCELPEFNSFRKGKQLITQEDVTINILYERNMEGELSPEAVGLHAADKKSLVQINNEIHSEKKEHPAKVGERSGLGWIQYFPRSILRLFITLASRSIRMKKRFGVIAVTSVGMLCEGPLWLTPISSATVCVSVGSMISRPALVDGELSEKEYLCLTLSFDHDIIDGAPAARFVQRFKEILTNAEMLEG